MHSTRRGEEREGDAALQIVQQHAAELLRFARRFSHCDDDAHDAYQRTVEILVRRMRRDPPAQPLPWLRTVLRREALALRAERERLVGRSEVDLDRHVDRHAEDPAERVVGHERLRHAAEALQRLKPQEVAALVLRAEGLTYREICARMGWTYTRTNRSVTEGRRALLGRLGAIESGAECGRWQPLLSALADGEATAADVAQLRPHLRSCPACRATLRDFHTAPAQVAALVPVALLPLAAASGGAPAGPLEVALHALTERATLLAARVQGALEALPGAKLAAVAASTAALAGGGVALDHATHGQPTPHTLAQTAGASAADRMRLMTVASPLPSGRAHAPARRRRGAAPRAEFASARASPSEFAPRADPTAEFAAAPPPTAGAVSAAASAAAPVAPPAATSEFAGP